MLFETMKSSKSIIVDPAPSGVIFDSTENPRGQGSDRTIIAIRFITTDFVLEIPRLSISIDTIFSNTAITVDIDAKHINTKKRVPQKRPSGIALKIFGRVIKISPAPAPGFTPNAKQVGKIINPAIKATKVSSPIM